MPMKSAKLAFVAVILSAVLASTVRLAAQEPQATPRTTHYSVHDLGTLGGTFSWAFGINDGGSIAGIATLPADAETHAFLWRNGVMTDLGTLGGPNSAPEFFSDEEDQVAGISEIFTPDQLGEDFCGQGTQLTCLPFLWRNGAMTALPTLGGNNGVASSVNNHGQVVGGAENSTPSNCASPFPKFQFRPVVWEHGQIRELPRLPGDSNGRAYASNGRGQIVGQSTRCSTSIRTSPVLWEGNSVASLGSFGGTSGYAFGINNQRQAFGESNLPGDTTSHAFLWEKRLGMKDLGTLPGDFLSEALGIDNEGRLVGASCDEAFNCRAFLWQHGLMTDLNTLIPGDSPWILIEADGINSSGQIAGAAFNTVTGETHAFLAIPRHCGWRRR